MKKMICLALCAALMMSLFCVSAGAVGASYNNTKEFLAMLDDLKISYTVVDSNEENDYITVKNSGEKLSYTINYFFSSDEESVSIRVWDVITYSDADLSKVLRTVNTLNNDYKWVTFVADESDNTVTAEMDLIVREGARAAEITMEATMWITELLEVGYEALGVYNK